MKIYSEKALKELLIRYGTELRTLRAYIDLSLKQDVDRDMMVIFYNECRLRLLFINKLKELLVENRKPLEEYNGQYISLVRDINKLKTLTEVTK